MEWLVYAEERSMFLSTVPSVVKITDAYNYAARGVYSDVDTGLARSRRIGHWVGEAPRVTLHNDPLSPYVTRVAWIYQITDAEAAAMSAEALRTFPLQLAADVAISLRTGAAEVVNTWEVRAIPYSATANGPLSWWESGAAAREAVFTNDWQAFLSRLTPNDNPIGPNNPLAQGPGGDPKKDYMGWFGWIVGGIAVTVLAVEFGPVVASWLPRGSASKPAPTRQKNPSRRRAGR